jgi:CHASE2 domain-containing sensor protein
MYTLAERTRPSFSFIAMKLTAAARRWTYWAGVVVFIVLGMLFSDWAARQDFWPKARYVTYQFLTTLSWRKALPQNTVVVLVDDDEYWRGEPARRAPIKRTYLAKLLRAIDAAEPAVIAVDFDLSSPTPDGSVVEHPDYVEETATLLRTIRELAARRKIVLPQNIGFDARGDYVLASDIHSKYDFGAAAGSVGKGYIALPYDVSRVPLALPLAGGGSVDSFALAIVKAYNADALARLPEGASHFPLGGFIEPGRFHTVAAGDVLRSAPAALQRLSHRAVIVGAGWHVLAYGTGPLADLHATPVGAVGGALLHANFVEAIVDGRLFSPAGELFLKALEFFLALGGALLFALRMKGAAKWGIVLGATVVLFVASYLALQNLGVFFESFLPIVFVWLHALLHRMALE